MSEPDVVLGRLERRHPPWWRSRLYWNRSPGNSRRMRPGIRRALEPISAADESVGSEPWTAPGRRGGLAALSDDAISSESLDDGVRIVSFS